MIAGSSVVNLCDMFTDPIKWARRWLTEFRDDPDGVVLFADHCLAAVRLQLVEDIGLQSAREDKDGVLDHAAQEIMPDDLKGRSAML